MTAGDLELRITHTRAEGTIVEGTSRGDGTAEILKPHGFRWGRTLGAWYLPHSRDRGLKVAAVNGAVTALRAAGVLVELDVDDTARPTAEVEADKKARATARTQALTEKADRRDLAVEAAQARRESTLRALPEGGEPVKVGHHSEGRHRRDIARAWAALGASVEAKRAAEEAHCRAEIAAAATERRNAPGTVANRIKKLVAEVKKLERTITGYTRTLAVLNDGTKIEDRFAPATGQYRENLESRLTEARDQLRYWEEVRAEQIRTGQATEWDKAGIKAGDRIRAWGSWYEVIRANKTTVTVQGERITHTIPYTEIRDHHTAEKIAEVLAAQAAELAAAAGEVNTPAAG